MHIVKCGEVGVVVDFGGVVCVKLQELERIDRLLVARPRIDVVHKLAVFDVVDVENDPQHAEEVQVRDIDGPLPVLAQHHALARRAAAHATQSPPVLRLKEGTIPQAHELTHGVQFGEPAYTQALDVAEDLMYKLCDHAHARELSEGYLVVNSRLLLLRAASCQRTRAEEILHK